MRSGFAGLVGRPNVGKSTLLNRLIGRKVAIMSEKPQTTRHRIQGVLHLEDAQVVFLDTPGIHRPRHLLGEHMVEVALRTLRQADVLLFLVEANRFGAPGDRYILDHLREVKAPVLLLINKIDLIPRKELLPQMDSYRQQFEFAEIVPVSALKGDNLDILPGLIVKYLPEGPAYYPTDIITDQPERLLTAELIREKVLGLTSEEVPHAVAVVVEEMVPRSAELTFIRATVYVEKESQKGILIGRGGQMLKNIGRLAREEIEVLLGKKVFLELWVKVKEDWRNREAVLRSLGYGPE